MLASPIMRNFRLFIKVLVTWSLPAKYAFALAPFAPVVRKEGNFYHLPFYKNFFYVLKYGAHLKALNYFATNSVTGVLF